MGAIASAGVRLGNRALVSLANKTVIPVGDGLAVADGVVCLRTPEVPELLGRTE